MHKATRREDAAEDGGQTHASPRFGWRLLVALALAGGGLQLGVGRVAAQGSGSPVPATECCLPLLFAIGARALSLGDAVTARTSPGSMFANPALIAALADDAFFVHNANTSLEKANTFTLLIRSEVVGTLALSFRLIDHGEQTARDPNGNPIGTIGTYEQVLTATYATRVAAGFNAGINYKIYQFKQSCAGSGIDCTTAGFSATTHGVDLGVQYQPPALRTLELGASIVHLGFPLQVVNAGQASPMPVRVRGGAALEVGHHVQPDSTTQLWLTGDLVANPRNLGESFFNVGAELSLDETIFVWAGWGGGSGLTGGAAIGVGLNYDRFDVGIAKSFVTTPLDDSEPLQVTFGIRF
jgi:hypothetical protein